MDAKTLERFYALRLNAKSEKNLGFEKWKNAKYCVQNPVRLGQSGLDNKERKKDAFCK